MSDLSSIPIAPGANPFFLPGGPVGVLVIHGYGGSAADYRSFGEQLNRAGYTVSVMRVAGHGQGHVALGKTHADDWRESVFQAARELRQHCQHIAVIGVSFGGSLAIDYAVHAMESVAALVLVNTPIKYKGGGPAQKILMRVLSLVRSYYAKPGLTDKEKAMYQESGSTTHWPLGGLLETYSFIDRFVRPALPRITTPTLLLRSTDDPYVTVASSQEVLNLLGSQVKTMVTIPGTTHRPFRQRESLDFILQQTSQFLSKNIAAQ